MEQASKTVFLDHEVQSAILAIFGDAKKEAVTVTPYVGLLEGREQRPWPHAQQAITDAIRRGVRVTFIVRESWTREKGSVDDLEWLSQNKVKVLTVEELHAKIYLNESSVVVSSMNLVGSSARGSREFALTLKNPSEIERLRSYVKALMGGAKLLERQAGPLPTSRSSRGEVAILGVCIRCSRPLALDPGKPLCETCYERWTRYKKEDYEKVCHSCGQPAEVSYARPLCPRCYSALAR
ncbi:MAG: hypothetical protein HY681_01235 [Chloroflexi bacterium]|nr:hypothetical protein [Chloroflexota bacterium]